MNALFDGTLRDLNIQVIRHHWSKGVRMHIDAEGSLIVTAPRYVPMAFIRSTIVKNRDWIAQQVSKLPSQLTDDLVDGQAIGKHHHLYFVRDNTNVIKTSIKNDQIIIKIPPKSSISAPEVQTSARSAITRALRREAEDILPSKVAILAETYGYKYKSVKIRKLKRRWGSCSSDKIITLNLSLMNLPDHLINYVIMHELTHTRHMHHQASFWTELTSNQPNAKKLRRELRNYRNY